MKKVFYVYIITNYKKTTLYTGLTNDMHRRLNEHYQGLIDGFSRQYKCKYLIYYESFPYINDAIAREKQIKKYRRSKKEKLIHQFNPEWKFLNNCIF